MGTGAMMPGNVFKILPNAVLKFSPGRTDFTLVLKIHSLVFVDIDAKFHKACLALPILLFKSASAPPPVKWQHYFQADLKDITYIRLNCECHAQGN